MCEPGQKITDWNIVVYSKTMCVVKHKCPDTVVAEGWTAETWIDGYHKQREPIWCHICTQRARKEIQVAFKLMVMDGRMPTPRLGK